MTTNELKIGDKIKFKDLNDNTKITTGTIKKVYSDSFYVLSDWEFFEHVGFGEVVCKMQPIERPPIYLEIPIEKEDNLFKDLLECLENAGIATKKVGRHMDDLVSLLEKPAPKSYKFDLDTKNIKLIDYTITGGGNKSIRFDYCGVEFHDVCALFQRDRIYTIEIKEKE